MEAPLGITKAVQELVNLAYQQGWEDRGRADQAEAVVLPQVQTLEAIPMTSEVDESLSYRDRFLGGLWPTNVSDTVKEIPIINLRLETRVQNAVSLAVLSPDDGFMSLTIGRILEVSPGDMMKDVRVRRGLSENGIKQLLDGLRRFGVELQYPAV